MNLMSVDAQRLLDLVSYMNVTWSGLYFCSKIKTLEKKGFYNFFNFLNLTKSLLE